MLPEQFCVRMKEMLGEEYAAFYASYDLPKYQALRINPLKTERDTFLLQAPFSLNRVPWTTNGYYYSGNDQPGRHPYHEAGVYYIQEPSAMAPAEYLMAEPGERILDLCAAPGGKSTQIACSMQGEGLIVCNEIHPARAKILSENIERMGVCNALVTNETPQKLSDNFREYFDRILVDAPCSGEGMFRKNEDACDECQVDKYDTPVTQSSDWKGGAVVIFAHVILISLLKNRVGFFQLFQCEDPRFRQIAAAEVQK